MTNDFYKRLFYIFFSKLSQAKPEIQNPNSSSYYYIPSDLYHLEKIIEIFNQESWLKNKKDVSINLNLLLRGLSIIDLGGGLGKTLLFIQTIVSFVYGNHMRKAINVDNCQELLDMSKSLYNFECENIDIRKYNFKKPAIIYYYNPFCDKAEQVLFEKYVFENALPGSLIIKNSCSCYWQLSNDSNYQLSRIQDESNSLVIKRTDNCKFIPCSINNGFFDAYYLLLP